MAQRQILFFFLGGLAMVLSVEAKASVESNAAALPNFVAETLTGDWGSARSRMAERGLDVRLTYTADVMGNVAGGIRRGWTYQGLLELGFDLDLERAMGWTGGSARISGLQIHGPGLTDRFVGSFAAITGHEARPATRLFEAWIEQEMLGGLVGLRVGQMAVDQEFYLSDRAGHFINATFGWPAIFSEALPAGGNAYPLATPGVRLRIGDTAEGASLRLGVFNGDADPDGRNRTGTRFRLTGGAFAIAEASYAFGGELPGAYRLGAWLHSGRFDDLRTGQRRRGNHGFYAVADQAIWTQDAEAGRGIGVFARIATVPGRRNPLDLAVDFGVTWQGMLEARPEDVLGVAVSHARLSRGGRGLFALLDEEEPLRGHETVLKLSYATMVAPGWAVQPSAQLLFNPGAVSDRRNAVVLGVRTSLAF